MDLVHNRYEPHVINPHPHPPAFPLTPFLSTPFFHPPPVQQHSNTYSAINALAGHYNSFGTQAPVPKKRLERLTKELNDAELLLSRDR
jgi:hypothetical protein